jgi:hypothetical protein
MPAPDLSSKTTGLLRWIEALEISAPAKKAHVPT